MKYNLETWEGRYAAVHGLAFRRFGEHCVYYMIGSSTSNEIKEFQEPLAVKAMRSKKDAQKVIKLLVTL